MRKRVGMAAVAAGLAVAAACGSGPAAVTVVARSASATSSAGSARVSMTVRISSASGPLAAGRTLQSEGAVDFGARQATFRVTTETGSIDAVMDGTVVYEHIPQLAPAVGGKTWLKIDLKTAGQVVGVPGLSSVLQSQPSDPTQTLGYLRGASSQITRVGHEAVRGVATTHYRATVDLNKAAASLGPDPRAALRQLIDRLGLKPTFPVDVWIDAQDRVRRMHLVQEFSPAAPAGSAPATSLPSSVELTMELFDFGTAVSVQPPPPDQVTDISDLINRSRAGSPKP
jgi:hypothetical protein